MTVDTVPRTGSAGSRTFSESGSRKSIDVIGHTPSGRPRNLPTSNSAIGPATLNSIGSTNSAPDQVQPPMPSPPHSLSRCCATSSLSSLDLPVDTREQRSARIIRHAQAEHTANVAHVGLLRGVCHWPIWSTPFPDTSRAVQALGTGLAPTIHSLRAQRSTFRTKFRSAGGPRPLSIHAGTEVRPRFSWLQ